MIPSSIPSDWTAREALTILEFIDGIREEIWIRYRIELVELIKSERSTNPADWEGFDPTQGEDF